MSPDRQLAGCLGKTPYRSKAEAIGVIRCREKAGRIKRSGRGKMTEYQCRFCRQWHIGSASG